MKARDQEEQERLLRAKGVMKPKLNRSISTRIGTKSLSSRITFKSPVKDSLISKRIPDSAVQKGVIWKGLEVRKGKKSGRKY